MKKYMFSVLLLSMLFCGKAHAQWVVTDPTNFAGNIANTVKEIATAGKTVKNTLSGFKEVEKLYNDTKKYYDALRKVNNLIGDTHVRSCRCGQSSAYARGHSLRKHYSWPQT